MPPSIRLATVDDAPAIAAIYAPIVRETVISFESEPPDDAEIVRRMQAVEAFGLWIVAAEGDELGHGPDRSAREACGGLLGYAYAGQFRARAAYDWSTEFTVYVDAQQRRRGVARGLYTSLIAAARVFGFRLAIGGITVPNPASVALHESLGFRLAGVFHDCGHKFGGWHGVGFWQLQLNHEPGPLPRPRRLADLRDGPELAAALRSGAALIRPPADRA